MCAKDSTFERSLYERALHAYNEAAGENRTMRDTLEPAIADPRFLQLLEDLRAAADASDGEATLPVLP
jgi:hypothetical protein